MKHYLNGLLNQNQILYFILIVVWSLALFGCGEEVEPDREPNSTCIYKYNVSTDASQLGTNPYELVNCVDYPNHQSRYAVNAVDCKCPSRP